MKRFFVGLLFALTGLLTTVAIAHAQIVPAECAGGQYNNECDLNSLLGLFEGAYSTGIAYLGGVTLLFFVIGGFVLLISGGRSQMVDLGKRILVGTIFGAIIVLTSYLAVDVIQTRVFELDSTQQIGADEQCVGKADGTACEINGQNVYVCLNGGCSRTSVCTFNNQKGPYLNYTVNSINYEVARNCWPRNKCNESSAPLPNMCPGSSDTVCCYISEAEYQIPN